MDYVSGRLLGSNELSFLSDGTNSTFRVMFKEPIEILPNTNYTASATLKASKRLPPRIGSEDFEFEIIALHSRAWTPTTARGG